jgi:hypothetical protein
MAKHTKQNEMAEHTLKHRARCTEGDFNGPWRTDINEAYNDAKLHRSDPDHQDHVVNIVTQQTIVMRYTD